MAPILKKDARSFGGAKPAPQCGYSKKEERLNFLTHFWAALVFAPIAAFLTLKALNGFGFGFKTLSVAAFAFFTDFAFAASALYHGSKGGLKPKFKLLDHISIFFMTFGLIFAAAELSEMPRAPALALSAAALAAAVFGAFLKIKTGANGMKRWSILFYSIMPCAIFIPMFYMRALSVALFLAAGASDLTGLNFYMKKEREFTHVFWHVFSFITALLDSAAIYFLI
ncbi:MAG: hemolysin III family protein [Opitutales bacterium]|nr:hemolysin III family protein [Opitutales bacterium]